MAQDNSERTIRRKLAGSDHVVEAVYVFTALVLEVETGEWEWRNVWMRKGNKTVDDPCYILAQGVLVEMGSDWEGDWAATDNPFVDGDC